MTHGFQAAHWGGELPPFPEAVRQRLPRKGPCCVEPWQAGRESTGYEPPEALRQPGPEVALCQQTAPIGVEEPDSSEESQDEGFLFLNGATKKRWATSFADAAKARKQSGGFVGPKARAGSEAISRLARGY